MVLRNRKGMSQGQLWFIILLILALLLLFPSTAFGKKLVNTSESLFTGTCKFIKIPILCKEESVSAGAAGVAGHNSPGSTNQATGVVKFDAFNEMLRDNTKSRESVLDFSQMKELFGSIKCIHTEKVNNQNVYVFRSMITDSRQKNPIYYTYRDSPQTARAISVFGLTASDSNDYFIYKFEDMVRSANEKNFDGWYQSAVATTFIWLDDAQPALYFWTEDVRMDSINIDKRQWGVSGIEFPTTPHDYILEAIKKGCGTSVQTTP